jgi:hypothetical protein
VKRLAAVLAASLFCVAAHAQQPYAGQQSRPVKSLSAQEVDDLLAGRGAGTAKAAELNRYPGPAHVLELKDRLGLTPEQEKRARSIHAGMQSRASVAGRRVVDAERALDDAFAKGAIDEPGLNAQVLEAGRLHAEFRLAHLAAHLEMKALLSPAQIARYDELRGYAGGSAHGAGKH